MRAKIGIAAVALLGLGLLVGASPLSVGQPFELVAPVQENHIRQAESAPVLFEPLAIPVKHAATPEPAFTGLVGGALLACFGATRRRRRV